MPLITVTHINALTRHLSDRISHGTTPSLDLYSSAFFISSIFSPFSLLELSLLALFFPLLLIVLLAVVSVPPTAFSFVPVAALSATSALPVAIVAYLISSLQAQSTFPPSLNASPLVRCRLRVITLSS